VQKVEPVDNPKEIAYQARCVCQIDELLPQTPDPDGGMMRERKFVPANEITKYIKWGKLGDAMFKDAIELYNVNKP
jgi:hypothetical protein